MSDTNETSAAIIAEMRCGLDKSWHEIDREWVRDLPDRLESALKREKAATEADALAVGGIVEAERHKPGNAAAMREALEKCMELAKKIDESLGNDESTVWNCRYERSFANSIVEIARAALSAPPRNCDVGTAEEQERRYRATGEVYHTLTLTNALAWAQTPYAEEGAGK